jgi:hypothetical protein
MAAWIILNKLQYSVCGFSKLSRHNLSAHHRRS